jgi:NAD(P)-dependent dehydrogenase (short-subunit alcohol dehydrogenase family)
MESHEYLTSLFSLDDRIAVVTGSSGTIPSALSRALLRAGARVILWSRGIRIPVEEAVARIEDDAGVHGRAYGMKVEAGNEDSVGEAFRKTVELFGIPDILVNGVGGNRDREPLIKADVEGFKKTLELNLVSGFLIPTKAFAATLIDADHPGCVINIAAMSSFRPFSGVWGYDAAKTGIVSLTQAAARELAPHGIRVNAIAPGFFIGDQNKSLLLDAKSGELTERGRSIILRTPFGRFGTIDELEGVAVFLASERASGFMTGVTVPIDGGFLTDTV